MGLLAFLFVCGKAKVERVCCTYFAEDLHVGSARSIGRGHSIQDSVDVTANHLDEGVLMLLLRRFTKVLDEVKDVGAGIHRVL